MQCRICYTEREDELFRPCTCNSVVHRQCLNEWRVTNVNPNSLNQCEICLHQYRYRDNLLYSNKWHMRCLKCLINNRWLMFLLYFAIISVTTVIIASIDQKDQLADNFERQISNNYTVYYLFSACIVTMGFLIMYLIHLFCTIHNRQLYYQYYQLQGFTYQRIFVTLLALIILTSFIPILGIFFSSIFLQLLLIKHYETVLRLEQTQRTNILDISEYEEIGGD